MCGAIVWETSIISTAPIAKLGATKQLALAGLRGLAGGLEVEAGGADDGVDARLQAGADVVERGVGDGEVDDDVGLAEHVGQLDPERRVRPAGQLHAFGRLDGLADRLAHAPGGAGDGDPDHAATRASLTGASAARKRPSSAPTQAAESRSAAYSSAASSVRSSTVDRVDPGQHLVEAFDRQPEQGRAGDPRHPRRGRLRGEHEAALDALLGPRQLLRGDRLRAQPRQLGADDRAGLLDVVLAGADVGGDQALVGELLVVGADRVGEAALLAHLAEEARGGRAAEDRVEHGQRVAALVVAAQAGRAEADVVLLGLLRVEAEPGAAVERRLRRQPRRRRRAGSPAARPARRCGRGRGGRRRRRRSPSPE